ncbi:MAG: Maf family protein [Bacilli bacterium]|nr:Maf family protein [Bacilli bacterium]
MLILASSSPRRKTLLKKLTSDYTIIVPEIDESLLDGIVDPYLLPAEESKLKAYAISAKYPNDEILSCDTIVYLDGQVLGKPHNEETAIKMLKMESGKKQIVISGYTYISPTKEITRSVKSVVYFKELSDGQIVEYVKKYQPLGKAGAYGIQDEAGLIERIEGSYDNIVGLPVEDLRKHVFSIRGK